MGSFKDLCWPNCLSNCLCRKAYWGLLRMLCDIVLHQCQNCQTLAVTPDNGHRMMDADVTGRLCSAGLSQHKHTEVFIRPGPGPHTNTVHSHRSLPGIIFTKSNENIAVKLCGQIILLIILMKWAFSHCILGHYRNNHVLYLSHRITSESCMVTILSSFNSGDLCSYSPSSQKTDTKTSTSKPSSAPAVC